MIDQYTGRKIVSPADASPVGQNDHVDRAAAETPGIQN